MTDMFVESGWESLIKETHTVWSLSIPKIFKDMFSMNSKFAD